MRNVSQTEYEEARAALAAYGEWCKPYVQRNGWTVIPADAPRLIYGGAEMTTDRVNAYSTAVELHELARDKPARFSAYVQFPRNGVTTWTGEEVAFVCDVGSWSRNNFGARSRRVKVRAAWGAVYSGREYDSRQFVNFKRLAVRS